MRFEDSDVAQRLIARIDTLTRLPKHGSGKPLREKAIENLLNYLGWEIYKYQKALETASNYSPCFPPTSSQTSMTFPNIKGTNFTYLGNYKNVAKKSDSWTLTSDINLPNIRD